jgi:hypothetical protein
MHLHDRHRPGLDLLEDAHTPIALLVGTVVASPVLLAALSGRQDVGTAAALYAAAIIGSWLVVGLLAGALAAAGRGPTEADGGATADTGAEAGAGSDVARDPDPVPATR